MYRVIACGVNHGPSAEPLQFAEKDASDVAAFFRGALGPPVSQVVLLRGAQATGQNIESEIIRARFQNPRPHYLVFYFSGHGARDGVLAADGTLPYELIIRALRLASIPFSTVILDVCYAASYLDFLKEARLVVGGLGMPPDLHRQWLLALSSATPGNRLIFSTGADRTSGESSQLGNGIFTYSLLTALRRCRGDIHLSDGRSWISDQRAFARARAMSRMLTDGTQIPVERGLTGDFPLALSQAEEPVGYAHFVRTSIAAGSLNIHFEIEERKHVETRVRWKLLNAFGEEIATSTDALYPRDDAETYRGNIDFPHAQVRADGLSSFYCITQGEALLEWVLSIEDEHGHVLDEKVVPLRYRW